jgi:hypothetical protein
MIPYSTYGTSQYCEACQRVKPAFFQGFGQANVPIHSVKYGFAFHCILMANCVRGGGIFHHLSHRGRSTSMSTTLCSGCVILHDIHGRLEAYVCAERRKTHVMSKTREGICLSGVSELCLERTWPRSIENPLWLGMSVRVWRHS